MQFLFSSDLSAVFVAGWLFSANQKSAIKNRKPAFGSAGLGVRERGT